MLTPMIFLGFTILICLASINHNLIEKFLVFCFLICIEPRCWQAQPRGRVSVRLLSDMFRTHWKKVKQMTLVSDLLLSDMFGTITNKRLPSRSCFCPSAFWYTPWTGRLLGLLTAEQVSPDRQFPYGVPYFCLPICSWTTLALSIRKANISVLLLPDMHWAFKSWQDLRTVLLVPLLFDIHG